MAAGKFVVELLPCHSVWTDKSLAPGNPCLYLSTWLFKKQIYGLMKCSNLFMCSEVVEVNCTYPPKILLLHLLSSARHNRCRCCICGRCAVKTCSIVCKERIFDLTDVVKIRFIAQIQLQLIDYVIFLKMLYLFFILHLPTCCNWTKSLFGLCHLK